MVVAQKNRIAEDLLKESSEMPQSLILARLIKRLEDELGLAENVAHWAVESWALALGVIQQPLPVSVPVSPKPVSLISQAPSTPAFFASPTLSTGGRLRFPKFSVGKVKSGSKEQTAVGEIDVPQGQTVELSVSDDVTDFSFLKNCDPDSLVKQLNLTGCTNFGDNQLVNLKNFANLQSLNLSRCNLRFNFFGLFRESWMNLKCLENLLSLNLSDCLIQDDGLGFISNLSNLRSLNLSAFKNNYGSNIFITDSGLKHLGNLNNLEMLNISKFKKITGLGVLANLGHMTQLKSLDLSQCENVSAARLQELKQMLPNTRILP